jgi:hypothetical protein
VVEALEQWASGEAARILVGVFLVAAIVMAAAALPTMALERRGRTPVTDSPASASPAR